ncbi:MAG: iron-sulfur cluster assembly scaffold protein [Acidobacteria bacterium]|nr:iron-sulfur cluster assembly scaffold protein [Acidobacteriota bacterium]
MREVYSETAIDHGMNPRNVGEIQDADGFGKITGPCGDTMSIWIKIKDNTIIDAKFTTDGCGTSRASGSMATEIAKGKDLAEAQRISRQDILDGLGGLPEESEHCALLAANTLNESIKSFLTRQKSGNS